MSVAAIIEFPGMNGEEYKALIAEIGTDASRSGELRSRIGGPAERGWRVVELWESPAAFERFRNRLESSLRRRGQPLPEVSSWGAESLIRSESDVDSKAGQTTEERKEEDLFRSPAFPPDWLNGKLLEALYQEGLKAIPGGDVPAAAAVVYGNSVILGHNDVLTAGNAGGHADINAITNAIRHFGGPKKFRRLDREKLYLVTTYEPCPMCEGAIALEHRFKPENVFVLMLKEAWYRAEERETCGAFRSGWRYVACDELQQRLFCEHPAYRKAHSEKCGQEAG